MERYCFYFEYDGNGWMIICYENGRVVLSFVCDEDILSDSIESAQYFLKNGGKKYYYNLPSYDSIAAIDVYDLPDQPIEGLDDYLSISIIEKTKSERYVFDFEYDGNGWMIICYENGCNVKSFSCDEHIMDKAMTFVEAFLKDGGKEYYYNLPSYDSIAAIDVYDLPDQPIEGLDDYLSLSIINSRDAQNGKISR